MLNPQGAPSVELLAPAGGVEALHAAVAGGANAVYLGLESFNARRNANNFTVDTLGEACDYAHLRGAKVYITLNTAILPSEAERALECARQAYRAGADAFIVQDVGVAAELTRTLPQASLHISTQMNTHNAAGIHAAAKLGASRVTLARELSLAELEHLSGVAASLGMEVETFVHGALCVCYSGQCFMSSMIGGRSANRGMCAQACRLPYELHNRAQNKALPSPGEHLLSPQDLCAIDLLPELVAAGVASLKIEGRMKSADYVFAVTSAYRSVLDRVLFAQAAGKDAKNDASVRATSDEHQSLEEAFSRGFTEAYLLGQRGNNIMSYGRPNNRGVFVGRVASVRDGVATIAAEEELHEGDVLEFWTNKGHFAHTLGILEIDKAGNVRTSPQKAVGKGDRVFRVRNAAAGFADDSLEPRVRVTGAARLRIGEPLHIEFHLAGAAGEIASAVGVAQGDVVEPARTKAVTEEDVRAHIDRLGQTPFQLDVLDIHLDENVGIGFSQLHRVRAEALDNLKESLLVSYHGRTLLRVQERPRQVPAKRGGCTVAAWVTNPACARAAKRAGADVLYVPALNYKRGEAVIAGQRTSTAEQMGYPKQCVTVLPVVDRDPVTGTREDSLAFDLWHYVNSGKPVLAESLGGAWRAVDMGARVEVGPHVPIANRLSLETMAAWGVERVWLSPEITLTQIADLAKNTPVALGLTIMGAQELMVCEHCLLMSQGPCNERCDECARRKSPHYLKDRKGYEFPVVTDALGRGHVYNSVMLDVAQAVPELIAAGVSALMVDTTLMNVEETTAAVTRAVRARDVAQRDGNALAKMPGTTSGRLYRGVS